MCFAWLARVNFVNKVCAALTRFRSHFVILRSVNMSAICLQNESLLVGHLCISC